MSVFAVDILGVGADGQGLLMSVGGGDQRYRLLKELSVLGISAATISPDLDHLAQDLKSDVKTLYANTEFDLEPSGGDTECDIEHFGPNT